MKHRPKKSAARRPDTAKGRPAPKPAKKKSNRPAPKASAASPTAAVKKPQAHLIPRKHKNMVNLVGVVDVQWPGVRATPDGTLKRFYRMDSLITGVEGLLARKDCWLLTGVQDKLGPEDVTKLSFQFLREDKHSLIFQINAANIVGRKGRFSLLVSRNHEEHMRGLERRLQGLELAASKAPGLAVQLLGMGPIFLPDRPGRRKEQRPLLAAITGMPSGVPCNWNRNGQIVLDGATPTTLTLADSDLVRRQVVELVLRCYEPVQRDGIAPPTLRTGDLLVYKPARAPVKVAYAGGDLLGGRPNPVRLIARLFEDRGGGKWLPQDPDNLFRGAVAAVGRERARAWLGDYVRQATGRSVTSPGEEYVDALREYVVE